MGLTELVDNYGVINSQCNALKKEVKEASDKIKEELTTLNSSTFKGEKYEVKVTEAKSESFDESVLIDILKLQGKTEGIVKTKEYVDMDALEDAIYNGKIDPTKLVSAKQTKVTKKLTVKEIK